MLYVYNACDRQTTSVIRFTVPEHNRINLFTWALVKDALHAYLNDV